MAAQRAFPAILVGSILAVSAAGLAAGTHLRSLREGAAARSASVEQVGTRFETSALAAEPSAGSDPASLPSFSRIVIEPSGISRLEGMGPPGGRITLRTRGEAIAVTTVDGDGHWAVTLTRVLPPGEHRIGSELERGAGPVAGEDVRVFVPADLAGEAVVAYEQAPASPGSGDDSSLPVSDNVGRRAAAIADDATTKPGVIPDEEGKRTPATGVGIADGDVPGAGAAPVVPNAPVPTFLDRVRNWFGSASETYRREIARPLSVPAPGTPEAEALLRAKHDRKERTERDARRFAEERRRAEEALRAAKEKEVAEAKANGSAEKAEDAKRRQAEEAARVQVRNRIAAEHAARRTAEAQAQFEADLKRLEEAQRARDTKAIAEAQKAVDAAGKEYQARRAAAEERAAADKAAAEKAAAKAAAEKTAATKAAADKRAAEKAAAEKTMAQKAAADKAAAEKAAAEAARKEKARLALAAENEVREAARRKAEEARIADEARRRKEAEEKADEEQQEREYAILRRMIAEEEDRDRLANKRKAAVVAVLPEAGGEARVRSSAEKPATRGKRAEKKASKKSQASVCRGRGKSRRGYHYLTGKETLWGLARRYYGAGSKYGVIYRANRDRIGSNPDILAPCRWIRIPGKD